MALIQWLLANYDRTTGVTRGDATYLFNVKVLAATNPIESLLQDAYGEVATG